MLKKLGSDLLYMILCSVKQYKTGNILPTEFLGFTIDRVEEASDNEIADIIADVLVEIQEGDYIRNDFLENLENYFKDAGDNDLDSVLFSTLKQTYLYVAGQQR